MDRAEPTEVLEELGLKNRLAKKFRGGHEELDRLCDLISLRTKFPGWPAISDKWKEISQLGAGRETILTADYVMQKMGGELVSTAAKIRNEVMGKESAEEAKRVALEMEMRKKQEEREAVKKSMELAKAQGIKPKETTAEPPASKPWWRQGEEIAWMYRIQGNSVRFTREGSTYFSPILNLGGGLEIVKGPNRETLIVQSGTVRVPTESEFRAIENREQIKRERRAS